MKQTTNLATYTFLLHVGQFQFIFIWPRVEFPLLSILVLLTAIACFNWMNLIDRDLCFAINHRANFLFNKKTVKKNKLWFFKGTTLVNEVHLTSFNFCVNHLKRSSCYVNAFGFDKKLLIWLIDKLNCSVQSCSQIFCWQIFEAWTFKLHSMSSVFWFT